MLELTLLKWPFSIEGVETFKRPEQETIKVSVIEDDLVMRQIFRSFLERIELEDYKLDIQAFPDGAEFLQSSWYQSARALIFSAGTRNSARSTYFPMHGMIISYIFSHMLHRYFKGKDDDREVRTWWFPDRKTSTLAKGTH